MVRATYLVHQTQSRVPQSRVQGQGAVSAALPTPLPGFVRLAETRPHVTTDPRTPFLGNPHSFVRRFRVVKQGWDTIVQIPDSE